MAQAQGLVFRKLDLHVHTPASECYHHKHTAVDIVQTALERGLDAIAITDHNTAGWVDEIKTAAERIEQEGKHLVVFPGVEISTHEGYHIIALFDITASSINVQSLLNKIDIDPGDYGRSDKTCKQSVYFILEKIHDCGGLSILAHIDARKGAFFEAVSTTEIGKIHVPGACAELFNDDRYDAVEIEGAAMPDGFDEDHQIRRKPAYYWASDNLDPDNSKHHSKEGIGARYSSFKLDEINLEGLRQCFVDPEHRIWLGEIPQHNWPHIIRMHIGHDGFLKHQRFEFHPGLNCLIGGKGVGKSLAIEFLRFALGQPSPNVDIRKDYEIKLEKRLLPCNTVEVEFQLTNGTTYVLERTYESRSKDTFTCTNQATGEAYGGDIAQLFPILAYSQTEVVKISEDQEAQLHLLDSLFGAHSYQKAIEAIQVQLNENDRSVADALFARAKLEEVKKELSTLEESIKNIDKVLEGPLLQQVRQGEAKARAFLEQLDYIDSLIKLREQYSEEVVSRLLPTLPQEVCADPILLAQLTHMQEAHRTFANALMASGPPLLIARHKISEAQSAWQPEFDALQAQYRAQLQGTSQAALEIERNRLVDQQTQVMQELVQYKKLAEGDLPELLTKRTQLLDQLDARHNEYYKARKRKFETLTTASEGKLQLTLAHAANCNAYLEAIKDILKGSGPGSITTANREKIAKNVLPRVLGELIIDCRAEELAETSGLTPEMSRRAMDKFWDSDNFVAVLALQHAYYPQDVPSIQFNKGREQFAELNELSVGQKSTALLIIALCDGSMPVIIDQPEDALDIASVWQDIAVKLRAKKSGRQFILTTHNSSLAVGGDSDKFLVLTPQSGEHAKVAHRGAIDRTDVRRAVIDHLEGGDEPYKLRQRKYNIK